MAADAFHERDAAIPAKNDHGSSRCTRTAASRPLECGEEQGGASIHSTAATARNQPCTVSRDAHSHAPSAARGSEATKRYTTLVDGAQNVMLPRAAST